jgi:hypothetical protein
VIRTRPILSAMTCAAAVLATGQAAALGLPVSRPIVLGGASPPGCGVPAGAQAGAEAEPHLAVDPADPSRLALAWQQDRNRTGAATALALRTSVDGGRTWREASVPGLTGCPLAFGNRASDPWVSFGGAGRLWLASVPGSLEPGPLPTTRVAVATAAGPDGPWAAPTFADPGPAFHDKESLTADPMRPGTAYAVWTRGATEGWFARTDDAGASWSSPLRIARGTGPKPALGLVLHVVPGGGLVVLYGQGPLEDRVRVTRSSDGGATWSAPRSLPGGRGRAGLPEPRGLRTGAFLPQVGARGRRIVVATTDVRRRVIRVTESRDAGRSWSRARTAVRGPGTPFLPAPAVHANGTIGMTSYRLRARRRAEVWFHHRRPGRSWRSRRLTAFSLREAPRAGRDRFLADYTGLVATAEGFVAAYVVAGAAARNGPSDVAVVRVRLR